MKRLFGLICALTVLLVLPALAFNQADVDRLAAGDKNMQGADLSGAALFADPYDGVNFSGANLSNATMIGRLFQNCDFRGANLRDAQFRSARFVGCDLSGQDFSGVGFSHQQMMQCSLRNARFNGAFVENVLMHQNDIAGVKFDQATLKGGRWYQEDGTGIIWDSVTFQQPSIVLDAIKISEVYKPYLSSQIPVGKVQWVAAPERQIDSSKVQLKKNVKTYKPATPKGVEKGMLPVKQ
ncbi:pentapeptide repeat-containing protein [uncultured Pseudodesulfovibrio sp.]|uniref:pentapeptide repeat-containing protein n=1 Tax=uncultured Pseudodesulfovibrio sp. TaxID=2035858 RepID=UPI0029C9AED4|nr:pentapeptide repeat-containing protein [uncultured Pseudodesulfovibrio sp.]